MKINQESKCLNCAWRIEESHRDAVCMLNPPVYIAGDPSDQAAWAQPVVSIHSVCSKWTDGSKVWE